MMAAIEPNCSINLHYKSEYIRVTVQIPGLKTQFAGINKRKVDPKSAEYSVSFADNQAVLDVTMKSGTLNGTRYHKELTQDDLNCLVSPEPQSYHEVADGEVKLYIRKR